MGAVLLFRSRNLAFVALLVVGLSETPNAFAQTAPPPPAPTGTGGTESTGGTSGVVPAFSSGSGLGGDVFVPGQIGPNFFKSTSFDTSSLSAPTSSYQTNVPAGSNMAGIIGACFQALAGLGGYNMGLGGSTPKNVEALRAARAAADRANDEAGFKYEPTTDREVAKRAGASINSIWAPGEQGCQKFISKDGEVGPWGRTALEEMKKFKDVYEDHVPSDMGEYCPAYQSMNADRRLYFRLWFFSSLAKPESSCRSNAVNNAAPNGAALGLFQLESPACARVGLHYSSQELLDPHNNIRCAVAVFAKEMKNRSTMFIGTSKGPKGTYWGPLRNDDHNLRRGGDIAGGQRMRSLLGKYPDCQK